MKGKPVRTRPSDWVEIYTNFSMLYSNRPDTIKRRAYHHVRSFILELVESQLLHLRHLQGIQLLCEYIDRWERTYEFVCFMKRLLHHLHQYWIWHNSNNLKNDPVRPIDKLLMFYWREKLLTHLPSVVDVALELIQLDRGGNGTDCSLVKRLVDNLVILGSADIYTPPDPRGGTNWGSSTTLSRYNQSFPTTGATPSAPIFPQCDSSLSLYHQLFEQPYLARTVAYYKAKGKPNKNASPVTPERFSTFMNEILSQLQQEETRARQLLHEDSVIRVRQAAQDQLIGNQLQYLQTQLNEMIQFNRPDDLHLLYSLLKRIDDGLTPVRSFFIRYIRTQGNSIVVQHVSSLQGKTVDMSQNLVLIEKLVQLYLKHSSMVRRCFDNSSLMLASIDDAFRGFINRTSGTLSIPTLLAYYMDNLLRQEPKSELSQDIETEKTETKRNSTFSSAAAAVGLKDDDRMANEINEDDKTKVEVELEEENKDSKPSVRVELDYANVNMINALKSSTPEEPDLLDDFWEDETAATKYMTELVRFFMYLDDKDLFCEAYRRLFAARLLSAYDETLETQFITRLEKRMGGIYTRRYRGMMQDIQASEALTWAFRRHVEEARMSLANSKVIKMYDTTGDTVNANITPLGTDANEEIPNGHPQKIADGSSSIAQSRNKTPPSQSIAPVNPAVNSQSGLPPVALRVRPAPSTQQQPQTQNTPSAALPMRNPSPNLNSVPQEVAPSVIATPILNNNNNVGSSTPSNPSAGAANTAETNTNESRTGEADTINPARQLVEDAIAAASSPASARVPPSSSASIAIPALLSASVPYNTPHAIPGSNNQANLMNQADDGDDLVIIGGRAGFINPGSPDDVGDTVNNGRQNNNNIAMNNDPSVEIDKNPFMERSEQVAGEQDKQNQKGILDEIIVGRTKSEMQVMLQAVNLDVTLRVLNGLHWPTEAPISVKLPPVLDLSHSLFTMFYMQKRAFRKLTWLERISSVTLEARYSRATFPVITSPSQAALLLLFNDSEVLSVQDIASKLGVGIEDTLKLLKPLTTGGEGRTAQANNKKRCGLIRFTLGQDHSKAESSNTNPDKNLRKRKRVHWDDSKEEDEDDAEEEAINKIAEANRLVCVNDKFEQKGCSMRSEVLIPLSSIEVGSVEDVAKGSKKVVVDRNMQVDAAIVRTMKAKKECTHSELCAEVMKLLSSLFMADSRLIKSRIDRLIDMEYMHRDEEDLKIYRYLF